MKLKLLLLTSIIILASCNKNQKIVRELEGTWKVVSEKKNGVARPDSTYNTTTYKFEKCRVKKGACPGILTEDGKAIGFTYDITDKGTKITITVLGISEVGDILEHSKTRFAWKTDDGKDVEETTIEKL